MNTRSLAFGIIILVALVTLSNSVYIVQQTDRAILLRFGAVAEADVAPGLHFKLPVAETVRRADGRVLTLDSQS